MRTATRLIAVSATLIATVIATAALAQVPVNLTGRYLCIERCATAEPGQFAYVTQNGWELNVVSEVGAASRAWVDYPGRLWINAAQMGAIYSPDGLTIQFDNGTIWQRALELPPPPPPRRHR